MPKLRISDKEKQDRTLLAIIQAGKTMEDINVKKMSKLTGIPQSTLYQEKERIGREVI